MDFEGVMEFTNNSGNGEGAVYLLSFGQMNLLRGARFIFDGNVGK